MQRDPEWRAFGECRGEGRRGVRRCSAWSEFNGAWGFEVVETLRDGGGCA